MRLRTRGIKQTMMSAEVEAGTFEHARCILLVEIYLPICAREIAASPRTLKLEVGGEKPSSDWRVEFAGVGSDEPLCAGPDST